MSRRVVTARRATASGVCLAVALGLAADTAAATGHAGGATAGAPGIGDRYYPLDGNGGYDVERYVLDLRYDPETARRVDARLRELVEDPHLQSLLHAVLVDVVASVRTSPAPLRLPLGRDTYRDVRASYVKRLEELDAHRDLALSVLADDAPPT